MGTIYFRDPCRKPAENDTFQTETHPCIMVRGVETGVCPKD